MKTAIGGLRESLRATAVLLVGAAAAVAGLIGTFVALADEVVDGDTLAYDELVLNSINTLANPWLDAASAALTELGGPIGVTLMTVGLAALLWQRNMRRKSITLVAGVGGASLLNLLLKSAFERDRPQLWERIVFESSYSFPSGHAMASSALAFSLMILFWPTRWRWLAVVGSIVYMLVIAFTRLYLGVHYPSDILAGWAVSGAWVVVAVVLLRYRYRIFTSIVRRFNR